MVPDFGFRTSSPGVVAVPGGGFGLTQGTWHHVALTYTGSTGGAVEKVRKRASLNDWFLRRRGEMR